VAHGRIDQRGGGRGQLLSGNQDRALLAGAAQRLGAGERLRDPRGAGAGENGSEGVKNMFLGRPQRLGIEGVKPRARQIARDLLRQCATADHCSSLKG